MNYLVPANSKKSLMILGIFRKIDLILFLTGASITFILLLIFDLNSVGIIMLVLAPLLVSTFLVLPVPNYHNFLQFFTNVFIFFTKNQRHYWRGWCIRDESK